MPVDTSEARRLTTAIGHGDNAARSQLMMMICQYVRAEVARCGSNVKPAELVRNSLAALHSEDPRTPGRLTFLVAAAQAMRSFIFEMAQGRDAQSLQIELQEPSGSSSETACVEAVNDVLERLEDLNERHLRVAEVRYFTGMTNEETARALDLGLSMVKADWVAVKTWVKRELAAR